MRVSEIETLYTESNAALINTRQKRFNIVNYTIEVEGIDLILNSIKGKLRITTKDEIVLRIILTFGFIPSWLLLQWYTDDRKTIGGSEDAKTKIESFIEFGLLFQFPSAIATFLMPTDSLASLFGEKLRGFVNPPYNTLVHTISEEQVMFDCCMGNASYVDVAESFVYMSKLVDNRLRAQHDPDSFKRYKTVIPESKYSCSKAKFKKQIPKFNDIEARLKKEVFSGERATTTDLKEGSYVIHKKLSMEDYEIKVPDLVVPAFRKVGTLLGRKFAYPQSIALEVELTGKGVSAYEKILDLYWDNYIYGKVVYLISDDKTRNQVLKAMKNIKAKHAQDEIDVRTCSFEIVEFEVPYDKSRLIFNDDD